MMGPQIVRVLRILCVLSVAICTRAFPQSYETGRMSNGKPYDHDVYPYVVALKVKEEGPSLGELSRVCSGTMISPLFAMTAAHCTYGKVATDITVRKTIDHKSYIYIWLYNKLLDTLQCSRIPL